MFRIYFICLLLLLPGMISPEKAFARNDSLQEIAETGNTIYSLGYETFIPQADTNKISASIDSAKRIMEDYPDSARKIFEKEYFLSEVAGYERGVVKSLFDVGFIYMQTGDYQKSMYIFRQIMAYKNSAQNTLLMALLYNNMGILSCYMGDYEKGFQYYYAAMAYVNKNKNDSNLRLTEARLYINISLSLEQLKQYQQSLYYMDKGIALAEKYGLYEQWANLLVDKALYYQYQNDETKARLYYQQALVLTRKYQIHGFEQVIITNLADMAISDNNLQAALNYLQDALKLDRNKNLYYTVGRKLLLGKVYIRLKRYKDAEKVLLPIEAQTKAHELMNEAMEIDRLLSSLYEAQGDYKKAFTYQQEYMQQKDSITDDSKTKNINQLEIKYRTAQKDKELTEKQLLIAHQQARITRNRAWIWISSLGLLLVTITSFFLYYRYRHKQLLQAESIRVMKQEQEMQLLKAMMSGEERERMRIGRELHDGVGGLLSAAKLNFSTIQKQYSAMGETNDFKNALSMVDRANDELRKTAHNLMPEVLLKEGLGEAIYNYCAIIGKSVPLKILVDAYGTIPRLDKNFELSVYRVVQELLNNILKHAHATEAIIQLNWLDDSFNITVEDNGIGIAPEKIQKASGIGLKNIQTRIQALNGHMELDSHPNAGTTICLQFDINNITPNTKTA